MNSPLFSLNLADAGKALLLAFLTAVLLGIIPVLESGTLPTLSQLGGLAIAGLAAALAYLVKNVFTSSTGKLLTPEDTK